MSYMRDTTDLTLLASGVDQREEHVEIEGVGRVTVESTILPSESVEAMELLSKKRTLPRPSRRRGRRGTKNADADADVTERGEGFFVILAVKAAQPASARAEEALRSFVVGLEGAIAQTVNEPRRLTELADRISPAFDPPSPAVLLQARRNAEARRDLLFEFGALTAAQLADARQASTANPSALASRWRKEGRIFGVTYRDATKRAKTYFPAFQFDDHLQPLDAVARVLEVFAPHPMTEWEIALWFTTPSGWLDDRRPADLLHEDPGAVVASAEHEVAAIAG
jgi:hypothetical protein